MARYDGGERGRPLNPRNMALRSHTIGNRGGDLIGFTPFQDARRKLELSLGSINDSVFDPGGGRGNPSVDTPPPRRGTVHLGRVDTHGKDTFERTQESKIEQMCDEFVRAKNLAQDEHEGNEEGFRR